MLNTAGDAVPEETKGAHPKRLTAGSMFRPVNFVLLLGLTLLIAGGLQFRIEQITGDSMAPTLEDGQRVVVERVSYRFREPRRGDMLVVNLRAEDWFLSDSTGGSYLKRVVGVAGDTVEIRDGQVRVNGDPAEPAHATKGSLRTLAPVRIPEGRLFLLGDNYTSSTDSRTFGAVPADRVLGRVWFALW